ncbi:hypothetical protein L1887_36932 [Cichorium endivia]|nr:hypothetical protein L1887_36932 [Cichorium endivia]
MWKFYHKPFRSNTNNIYNAILKRDADGHLEFGGTMYPHNLPKINTILDHKLNSVLMAYDGEIFVSTTNWVR